MTLFDRGCRATADQLVAALTGTASLLERARLERHAGGCARCAATMRDLSASSSALRVAFAPLRAMAPRISPARVRLALSPAAPAWPWGLLARSGRLAESSLAVVVVAFALSGLSAPISVQPTATTGPSIIERYFRTRPPLSDEAYFRWLRFNAQVRPLDPVIDPARFPAGGRFDWDQFAITRSESSPR
ncbi:MAG TPA: zf-HC2 domain-containing protein [Candidatus Limnocylindria bacterium]|nr:zf-HC2 domain-containing protein [Candidatus Limnocylindria bacterium]